MINLIPLYQNLPYEDEFLAAERDAHAGPTYLVPQWDRFEENPNLRLTNWEYRAEPRAGSQLLYAKCLQGETFKYHIEAAERAAGDPKDFRFSFFKLLRYYILEYPPTSARHIMLDYYYLIVLNFDSQEKAMLTKLASEEPLAGMTYEVYRRLFGET